MSLILNPLQRFGLWVQISQHEVAPKDLLILKDIQDKLKLSEADAWIVRQGDRVALSQDIPSEALEFKADFSRAESELIRAILDGKKFTVTDFDWLWPIYDYLNKNK